MSLNVPGIRPALFGVELRRDLDELRRFRHLVHHAYDIVLREDRLQELMELAGPVSSKLMETCERFVSEVARANDWSIQPPGV